VKQESTPYVTGPDDPVPPELPEPVDPVLDEAQAASRTARAHAPAVRLIV
jgi:hypothetical protein